MLEQILKAATMSVAIWCRDLIVCPMMFLKSDRVSEEGRRSVDKVAELYICNATE